MEVICKRASDLRAVKWSVRPVDLPVKEATEPAKFSHPDVYIDTETAWTDLDYVLDGSDSDLKGILSNADVLGRLNDFAEAFVLVYEIEHEVCDLIRDVCDEARLQKLIAAMRLPPEAKRPSYLEDFTFVQYKALICTKSNWDEFKPVFDTMRELVDADFAEWLSCETRFPISAARSPRAKPTASAASGTNCATTASSIARK